MEKIRIEEGDHYSFDVSAVEYWNDSGLFLLKGKRYNITAEGIWKDWYIPCGTNGYELFWMKPFKPFLRLPQAHWMSLLCSIDKSPPIFIGKDFTFEATRSGNLQLFANDVKGFYANNSGLLKIKIQQVI